MRCKVQIEHKHIKGTLCISGSKSISNRLLIIQALKAVHIPLNNGSNSQDTLVLQNALTSKESVKDIGLAGTAMRFLTAFYAIQNTEVVITGAARMKERPITDLVDSLRALGADIVYLEKEGFPPLQIRGKALNGGCLSINASISSQFISAILLVAPYLKNGIQLELLGEILSEPYIKMTLSLMKQQGVNSTWVGNTISVLPGVYKNQIIEVEADWSSISYLFEVIALSESGEVSIPQVFENSIQGDSKIMEFYKLFGISSRIENKVLTISKTPGFKMPKFLEFDCKATPDLAQTIAVTACGLGVGVKITGLYNLPLKETDRLEALKNELTKCGAQVLITNNHTIDIQPKLVFPCVDLNFKTYEDHRMAMCLAPLALKAKSVIINHAEVVNKSYKSYWKDLNKLSFNLH